ncbi:MAG: cation:proton antiporter [Bacteroidales bacterium]|jgi:Kef-type K+ transport system membrane component KefB
MENFPDQLHTQFQLPLQNPVLIFALILLIILLAPILFRRFKVPGIIGLIIAGVIVGPHGLNLLAKNSAIDLFSTIGLLYIMFIAGLELEIHEFRRNRYHSMGFGFLTFTLPLLLGFPACYYILHYGFTASLLTASIFSTQTMVAYPIVTKFGISRNKAVAVTVGGTIITDTAVLLLLAIITGSHSGTLSGSFWIRILIGMILLLVLMFVVVPRITKWFFIRLEGEKSSHYVFVLAIVFLAAFASQLAGLEPIIGAFIAGLALNRLVPQSSMLMNRIQFIGNALFIPFFLISVGMLVDLGVLNNGPKALWVAFVLTVVALVGKYVAARTTQHIFRYSKAQGLLIFGLSSSHAAATMAVILVGFKAGIIDENILNGTVVLILVTCLVASFATEKAAKKVILEHENSQSEIAKESITRESILIPVANFNNLERLLEFAQFIRDKKSPAPIRVLSVVDEEGDAESKLIRVRNQLEKLVGGYAFPDARIDTLVAADRNVPAGINRISRDLDIQTIILGWPLKETLTDRIFGHKTEHILNTSEKSIMLCRLSKPLINYKRMVLFCPPLAELEQGFEYLIRKTLLLNNEINRPMHLYANSKTREAIYSILTKTNPAQVIKDFDIRKWDYFPLFLQRSSVDDMIFIFSGRQGSVSYHPYMEHIVERVTEICTDQMVILLYPGVNLGDDKYDKYRDFSSEPLNRSMETFERIQRGLGKMIHKAE